MDTDLKISRRGLLAAGSTLLLGGVARAEEPSGANPLRFGVITDVHQDIIPDAVGRVSKFVEAMERAGVSFICQLGDFCIPHERNRPLLDAWNRFPGRRWHVLGNHDMDEKFTREQAAAFLGMPERFYTFDEGGVRFVVLDGNDPGGVKPGYKRFIARDQLDWLRRTLAAADRPVVVLTHQPLDSPHGVENHEEVRKVLADADRDGRKVLAVLSGHLHEDYVARLDGTPYLQINSASYFWMGGKYAHASLAPEAHDRSAALASTCPYKDPLWAVLTLDLKQGSLTVEGRSTSWVGGSPWDVGATRTTHDPDLIRPAVSSRTIPVG